MQCPNCGQPITEGARFCTVCGTPVEGAAQTTQEERTYLNWRVSAPNNRPEFTRQERKHTAIPPKELKLLLRDIEKGKGNQTEYAANKIRENLPLEAVPQLIKISKKLFISPEKNKLIIELLGEIGSDQALTHLLSLYPSNPEEKKLVNEQLKKLGGGKVIKHFVEKSTAGSFIERVFYLSDLYDIADVTTIQELIAKGDAEKSMFIVDNTGSNPLENSKSIGWQLVGAAIKGGVQQINKTRTAGLMVHPSLPLETIHEMPVEVQALQAAIFRSRMIAALAFEFGMGKLESAWNVADNSFKKTMLASAYVLAGKADARSRIALRDSLRSKNTYEKVFAYDHLIKWASLTNNSNDDSTIIEGMNSSDTLISTAVSSSVLYASYTPLIPTALNRTTHSNHNVRVSLIPAASVLAVFGDPECKAAMDRLSTDKSKDVREAAQAHYQTANELYNAWLESKAELSFT